jgi:hypothetical protein
MSRHRSDLVDLLASSETRLVEGEEAWTLRYLLGRVASGDARTFVIRVHARRDADGSEQSAVAGLGTADAEAAATLFRRVVEGRLLPVHLQDVVHDADVEEAVARRSAVAAPAS